MAITLDGNNLTTSGLLNYLPVQNTTSGTSVNFSGIPSTAKRVTLVLNSVSTNGTSSIRISFGTASGLATSGYSWTSSYAYQGSTFNEGYTSSGFDVVGWTSAANTFSGALIFYNVVGTNTWISPGCQLINDAYTTYWLGFAGRVALSASLSQISITTVGGSDSLDNGSAIVYYE